MTCRATLPLTLLLVVAPSLARGQGAPEPAEQSARSLADVPEEPGLAPFGVRWFGLFRDGKSLGTLRMEVRPGTAAAPLQVTLEARYRLGETEQRLRETLALDRRLRLVEGTIIEREGVEQEGAASAPTQRSVRREPGGFVGAEGAEARRALPGSETALLGFAQRHLWAKLLARRAARAEPPRRVRYVADEVTFDSQARQPDAIEIDVRPLPPVAGRDPGDVAPIGGVDVSIGPPDVGGWRYELRPDVVGELYVARFSALDRPDLVWERVADEAAARAPLPPRPLYPAGSPRALVLEVLGGLLKGDPEPARRAIDWPALRKNLEVEQPLAEFQAQFLARIAALPGELGEEDPARALARLAPGLEEEPAPKGGVRVRVPGEPLRLRLERAALFQGEEGDDRAGPWRIVDVE